MSDETIRVRCKMDAYYRDRIRPQYSEIDFHMEDIGANKKMPLWAEVVKDGSIPVKTKENPFKETTLHEMASKPKPDVSKPQ